MRQFEAMRASGDLLELAEVHGHRYGTPRGAVEAVLSEGRDMLFDIDWQGAQQLREALGADVVCIFILPPSIRELRARLDRRAEDSSATDRRPAGQCATRNRALASVRLRADQRRPAARLRSHRRHNRRRAAAPTARRERRRGIRQALAGRLSGAAASRGRLSHRAQSRPWRWGTTRPNCPTIAITAPTAQRIDKQVLDQPDELGLRMTAQHHAAPRRRLTPQVEQRGRNASAEGESGGAEGAPGRRESEALPAAERGARRSARRCASILRRSISPRVTGAVAQEFRARPRPTARSRRAIRRAAPR